MNIRKRKHPSGKTVFILDEGIIDGKRRRTLHATKALAKLAYEQRQTSRLQFGTGLADLPAAEVSEVLFARETLARFGASLTDAVDFYIKHHQTTREVIVEVMYDEYLVERGKAMNAARYLRQLKVSLGSLVSTLPDRKAHEVAREDIESWLEAGKWSPKTRNNYLGDASAMFGWGIRKGFLQRNPCDAIAKLKTVEGEIGTLTVPQCLELLQGAMLQPEMMGFVVLGMFAGLRPAEIQRLDWSAVDLQGRTVVVAGSQAKTRRRRVVDLSAEACAWIQASGVEPKGKITGRWWDARWRLFRKAAGWMVGDSGDGLSRYQRKLPRPANEEGAKYGKWPHNALRHTFASMHYALHQNEALLQAQMGHESADMLHRHYRALKTKAEAAQFWALAPE